MGPNAPNPADAWSEVVTLAAGFAHEIKNPLSTISLNLQLLEEDWQNPTTPREQRTLKRLQTLQRETTRLVGLLEDFLRYARTQDVQLQPCQLNQIVQEVLDFVGPQAARLRIQIRSAFDPALPVLRADPKLLKQALLNLAINAEEAMPEGGELLVRTALDGAFARIDVTDTGVGIPPQNLGRIFKVYFSTKEGGSGLGLPTARRIVELHGGTIEVESEPRRGTHFTLRLPIAPSQPEEDPS